MSLPVSLPVPSSAASSSVSSSSVSPLWPWPSSSASAPRPPLPTVLPGASGGLPRPAYEAVFTSGGAITLLCAVLLCAAAVVTVRLGRAAVARWTLERAGRAYDLPENYRPAVLRAGAAVAVLACGIVAAVSLPDGAPAARTPVAAPALPAPPVRKAPVPHAAPQNAVEPAPVTIARPAGGTLQRFADGTRVWLPPQYRYGGGSSQAFPMVVAYLPATAPDREPLYPAFVRHVRQGLADPFVIVLPRDCSADPDRALATAARHYRTVGGRGARAVVGVGALAACALRAALAHPGRFGAAVGVSGTYGKGAVGIPRTRPRSAPHVLLASATGEDGPRASALRLRAALRRVGVRVRIIDGVVPDRGTGGDARRHELALVSEYLTEELAGPARSAS
ncbi:hypothetical protein [Streptomyces sp. ICBB 8177]|uniref:hypothetical protein n=1 Tax=Streptomyces sp. ICBB 8177 TaxID=563922 RepID=UPI000D672E25|nr:hypothetical protein [Streptomyces sp. ICBB 8177]PWI42457.1 hypothetical protein CK485_08845 [Streptomyces sp. ICBB 8177]